MRMGPTTTLSGIFLVATRISIQLVHKRGAVLVTQKVGSIQIWRRENRRDTMRELIRSFLNSPKSEAKVRLLFIQLINLSAMNYHESW